MKRFSRAYLEITNVCNLACAFCPGTRREPRFMSAPEFRRAARELRPYTDYLYLHLMGEPLLHPALGKLLALAGELGYRVNLTTNGTLIARTADTLLASPALRKVGFSLHSFEANDQTGGLDGYLDDILRFVERARRAGVICELRLWNGRGADALNARILARVGASLGAAVEPPDGPGNRKLGERLFLAAADRFEWPDAQREDASAQVFCHGLRDHIGVLADGTVVPCCLDSEGTIALGNLFTQPLGGILESERARNIYEGFSRREAAEELCRRCGYARRF